MGTEYRNQDDQLCDILLAVLDYPDSRNGGSMKSYISLRANVSTVKRKERIQTLKDWKMLTETEAERGMKIYCVTPKGVEYVRRRGSVKELQNDKDFPADNK